MVDATLSPSERAAVRGAKKIERVDLPNGHVIATDGHHTLFATGSASSFLALWGEATALRAEATNA